MDKDKKKDLQEKDFVEDEGVKVRRKRSRKTIGEEGSRKQTAIGLLVTIVLGLVFYLPTELKGWWQELRTPEVITIEKPVGDAEDVSEVLGFKVTIKEKDDVEAVVEEIVQGLSGDYGIWVEKMSDESGIGINSGKVFTAASVIKLPILVAYYQAVDEGKIDPEETYVLKEKDRLAYGTGRLQNQPAGSEYSYREVARLVANESDNMGAQIMIGWLGGESQVESRIRFWGLSRTSVKENETTPGEIGDLLKQLYQGELLSEESRKELFASLTETVNEDRIPAGVPTGVKVVHKFGNEVGVVNDCGIVYGDEVYGICMLTTEVNAGEAEAVLPKISRVVWEWMGHSPHKVD